MDGYLLKVRESGQFNWDDIVWIGDRGSWCVGVIESSDYEDLRCEFCHVKGNKIWTYISLQCRGPSWSKNLKNRKEGRVANHSCRGNIPKSESASCMF